MSKRNRYHPSARIDSGSSATATAERKKRIPCTWSTQGFSCECEVCARRDRRRRRPPASGSNLMARSQVITHNCTCGSIVTVQPWGTVPAICPWPPCSLPFPNTNRK